MGLRGLNCCAVPFSKLSNHDDSVSVFDSIRPTYPNGVPKIKFGVLVCMSGLFPKIDASDDTTVFQRDCNYNILIRLKNTSSGHGAEIASFSFSTQGLDENNYFNSYYVVNATDLMLPYGIGDYSVRIYIKKEEESTWFLQSEQHFLVTN